MLKPTVIQIADLEVAKETQPRVKIDEGIVAEYAELMEAKVAFPPVEVTTDGKTYWLTDGYHRVLARARLKFEHIEANVSKGTFQDACWAAVGANKSHGLRRSNADKAEAVKHALLLRTELSDGAIAEHCGVSRDMVIRYRKDGLTCNPITSRVGKDGRKIKTENIGKKAGKGDEPDEKLKDGNPLVVGRGESAFVVGASDPAPSPDPDVPADVREALADTWASDRVTVLKRVLSEVKSEADAGAPRVGSLVFSAFYGHLQNAINALASEIPHAVCPYCKAHEPQRKDCRGCNGRGWVGKGAYKAAPEEMKV